MIFNIGESHHSRSSPDRVLSGQGTICRIRAAKEAGIILVAAGLGSGEAAGGPRWTLTTPLLRVHDKGLADVVAE